MSESFLMGDNILDHPGFLRCSVMARAVWHGLVLASEPEGRGRTDPHSVARAIGLSIGGTPILAGGKRLDPQDIETAIAELASERLLGIYLDGRRYFLPGRFQHNPGRRFWRASKHPAPDYETLAEFPEYLAGLLRLTAKGRLAAGTHADPDNRDRNVRARYCELVGFHLSHGVTKCHTSSHIVTRRHTLAAPTPTPTPSYSGSSPPSCTSKVERVPPPADDDEGRVEQISAQEYAYLLRDLMAENDPKAGKKITDKIIRGWSVEIERLHRIDERSWTEIESVIRWSQQDEFWKANIRSGAKLRKQFPTLLLQMQRPGKNGGSTEPKLDQYDHVEITNLIDAGDDEGLARFRDTHKTPDLVDREIKRREAAS